MGLLDEAIREHLELKRRHGADASEVQRMEAEALAPARVEPAPVPERPTEPAALVDAPPAAAPEPAEPHAVPARPPGRVVGGAVSMDDYLVEHPEPQEPEPAAPVPAEGADDVLEETPEFLQETPEHERLWFEQKPPKDFDF
jgi:hypothetical protein